MFENGIEVAFTECVTGNLMLFNGDDDVNWASSIDGDTIPSQVLLGAELSNETEYTIAGTVSDGAGNKTEIELSFATKDNE